MDDLRAIVESVFRNESGRIIASLIRTSRSFDLAEEAIQDAFTSALANWPYKGLPDNPAAWITAAAHRKLVDYSRREQTRRNNEHELLYLGESNNNARRQEISASSEDDRLRLIFTCCHPALNLESQVALTLRTLGGLTTSEIARAFLVSEVTLAQRLARAKRKIQKARIPYEVPPLTAMRERLSAVQAVLYLVFNEGYLASAGDNLVRRELCAEAIRLARILMELLPDNPENIGLLSLMLLQDSRSQTRCDNNGQLVPLEEQDRLRWRHEQISEGILLVERALGRRNPGPYQIEAAIAAVHGESKTAADTDWKQIAALYRVLGKLQPSPIIELNHAVAVAMSEGLECGLALIDRLGRDGDLESYHLFHAAKADLLRRMGRKCEAVESYRRALTLTTNAVERRYLQRRIHEVT